MHLKVSLPIWTNVYYEKMHSFNVTQAIFKFQKWSGWWFQFFYVHPYLGKISNLTNIFQMGWNYQPVVHFSTSCGCFNYSHVLLHIPFLVGRLFSHVADKRYWKALNNTGGNVGSLEMWRKSVILVSWPSDDLWVEYLGEPCCVDYLRRGPRFAVNIFVLEVSLKERVLKRIAEGKEQRRGTIQEMKLFFVNNDQLRCQIHTVVHSLP